MDTAARYQPGDRVQFARPGSGLGPVSGTVTTVAPLVNGDCPYAVTWVEDLDGTECVHPEDEPRLQPAT